MGTDGAGHLVVGIAAPGHPYWSEFTAFLEPARARGGLPNIIEPDEHLFGVLLDGEPVAAATARLTIEGVAEVVLVGGTGHSRWLKQLDEGIAAVAKASGAKCLRAFGRAGWVRALEKQGWTTIGRQGPLVAYERWLG